MTDDYSPERIRRIIAAMPDEDMLLILKSVEEHNMALRRRAEDERDPAERYRLYSQARIFFGLWAKFIRGTAANWTPSSQPSTPT